MNQPSNLYREPQLWLTHVCDMLLAWSANQSENRYPTDAQKKAALQGDEALLTVLDGLIASGGVDSVWTKDERTAVGSVFTDRLFPKRHRPYSLISALRRLDDLPTQINQASVLDRLTVSLLDAGCFPFMPARGQAAPAVQGAPSWQTWVSEYLQNSVVLERLLDTPQAADKFFKQFYAPGTGTSLPSAWSSSLGMSGGSITGWAWVVRNTPAACLKLWLKAGCNPHATDKVGRPVLAYTQNPETAHVILSAGANPLDMALPRDGRLVALRALFEGWSRCAHCLKAGPPKCTGISTTPKNMKPSA